MNLFESIKSGSILTEGSALRGSIFTEIARMIDDAVAEEYDEEEIKKLIQELIEHLKDTAESYNIILESTAVMEKGYNFSTEVRNNLDSYKGESTEEYMDTLNKISALEDEGKINTEEYQAAISYIQESLKLRESDYQTFLEAANPDNAEANELIKSSLKNAAFAYAHKDDLKKIGIDVEAKIWPSETDLTDPNSFNSVFLVGPNGRKLSCNTNSWNAGSMPKSQTLTTTSENYRNNWDEDTIFAKSYKSSKEKIKAAKEELPTLKRRLNLYERRYGKDSTQYKDLVRYIKQTEKTINDGVKADRDARYYDRPSEDVDYKNYLDSKKMADREKPYVAPKENPTVASYKNAREDERYQEKIAEENKKMDEEGIKRLAQLAQTNAEDKLIRDTRLNNAREKTKATLDELKARVEASKAKRGVK